MNPELRGRGSVIFLFPVGFLIVVLLGAITIDLANVWLQQRRLTDLADAIANDAVTFALDQDALRSDGTIILDVDRLDYVVRTAVEGHSSPRPIVADARPDASGGPPTVTVTLQSEVDLIFGRIVRDQPISINATGAAQLISEPSRP